MTIVKLVGMLALATLVSACVTTDEMGSGPLTLDQNLEERYLSYLAVPTYNKGQKYNFAFVINPKTNAASWYAQTGPQNSQSKAINKALASCGAGCKLFDLDKKIVWEGFPNKEKYRKIAKLLEDMEFEVRYYNPDNFEISSKQAMAFANGYMAQVEANQNRRFAFAISPDGKTWKSVSSHGRTKNNFTLMKTVAAMCNVASGDDNCVIYAINEELVTE